jgi:hypothetical protein
LLRHHIEEELQLSSQTTKIDSETCHDANLEVRK